MAGRSVHDAGVRGWSIPTIVAGALALAGCSSTDIFMDGRPAPIETASKFADRFRSLWGSGSGSEAQQASATPAAPGAQSTQGQQSLADCPPVDIRQGASTLQMNAPGNDQAMGLRYQATFGRTARQCNVAAGQLAIKIGVQGRLILGPAGTAGETTVPLRYAVVKEGMEPKTVWSKLYLLPVAVPPGQTNVPFTHVAEDVSLPMPPQAEFDHYVIYVGFDPQGATQEKKPERGKPKRSG